MKNFKTYCDEQLSEEGDLLNCEDEINENWAADAINKKLKSWKNSIKDAINSPEKITKAIEEVSEKPEEAVKTWSKLLKRFKICKSDNVDANSIDENKYKNLSDDDKIDILFYGISIYKTIQENKNVSSQLIKANKKIEDILSKLKSFDEKTWDLVASKFKKVDFSKLKENIDKQNDSKLSKDIEKPINDIYSKLEKSSDYKSALDISQKFSALASKIQSASKDNEE